jgi:hypothetical protein
MCTIVLRGRGIANTRGAAHPCLITNKPSEIDWDGVRTAAAGMENKLRSGAPRMWGLETNARCYVVFIGLLSSVGSRATWWHDTPETNLS